MSFLSWLQNLRSALTPGRGQRQHGRRGSKRAATHRPNLEVLEDRTLPSFSAPVGFAAGTGPNAVVTADFNGDGRLDLAVLKGGSDDVSILLGSGDGAFQATRNRYVLGGWNPQSLAVGDFNGDGRPDLVAPSSGSYLGGVEVLLGNGDGAFQFAQGFSTEGPSSLAVAVGDFDGDGKLDLAVTGFSADYVPGDPSAASEISVLLGHGDGTFAVAGLYELSSGLYAPSIATGDFNGDGKLDLVFADPYADAVGVMLGDGNFGDFTAAQFFAAGSYPRSVAVADLNGDGKLDLVTTNSGTVSVLLGNGDGAFQATKDYATGSCSFVAVADFNGDGKPDLVTGHYPDDSVGVLLGKGDGSFRSAQVYAAGSGPNAVAAGDLNGDGRPDLAVSDIYAGVSVLLNTGGWPSFDSPSFQVSGFPSPTTAGQAHTLTVTALDSNGNLMTGYTGTVHFTSSDPKAVLPADFTFTGADQGVHTFSATLKTAGSQAISVSDTTAGITGVESGITVNAAAASTMIVAGFPSPITAGVAGSITVTLKDPYGNIASGYRGTVHFTSSDARAVLPANYTFTAGNGGVHTFTATLKTAGTQSITAADTTTGSLTSTDGGITVNPARASQFIIAAPPSVTAAVPFSLTVTVKDAYGNVVTGYTGTIHFSSTDYQAKLPANYTFTAADKGIHTFTGLILRKKGNQKITISDTLNSSLTGNVIENVL